MCKVKLNRSSGQCPDLPFCHWILLDLVVCHFDLPRCAILTSSPASSALVTGPRCEQALRARFTGEIGRLWLTFQPTQPQQAAIQNSSPQVTAGPSRTISWQRTLRLRVIFRGSELPCESLPGCDRSQDRAAESRRHPGCSEVTLPPRRQYRTPEPCLPI